MINKINNTSLAFRGYITDTHNAAKKEMQNMHGILVAVRKQKDTSLKKASFHNFFQAQERFEYLDWLKQCIKKIGVSEPTIEGIAACNHAVNCPQELPEKCSYKKGDNAETEFFIERAVAFLTDAKRDYPNLTERDAKVLLTGLKRDLKLK